MKRKEFLKSLGMSSIVLPLIVGCSEEEINPINEDNASETTGSTTSSNNTDSCAITPSETEGPFPTKNPSSLERIDIRGDRTGIELSLEIAILNLNDSCAPIEGAIVDIWHCDKDGNYSEYGGTQMQSTNFTSVHFLRGRQVTDSNGLVKFTTIFPGWYQSRATHIHVHVYNSSGSSLLVTQIAFPEGNDSAVEAVNAASDQGYTKGMNGYTYNANDNVFSDGVEEELSTITGSVDEGYELSHSIVVSA